MAVGILRPRDAAAIFFGLETTMLSKKTFRGVWLDDQRNQKVEQLATVCRCTRSDVLRHLIDLAEVGWVPGIRMPPASAKEAGGDDAA